jgi:hypothetical protein
VLQALYFCKPFREKIIQYKLQQQQQPNSKGSSTNQLIKDSSDTESIRSGSNNNTFQTTSPMNQENNNNNNNNSIQQVNKQDNLLNCLAELFYSIVTMKKKKGTVQPKKFIARLRKDNGNENYFSNIKLILI